MPADGVAAGRAERQQAGGRRAASRSKDRHNKVCTNVSEVACAVRRAHPPAAAPLLCSPIATSPAAALEKRREKREKRREGEEKKRFAADMWAPHTF
uniref:Uncharacterized protein n=1 Tax=Oryza sativa subsp. japonica TaxID=39947 RepID=Q6ZLH0_ORYSJ|nr:hypothetical protein [Oryza sativa Japonica Group]